MVRLHIRLTPRASQDGIDGWAEDERGRPVLKVRVKAPPIEGRANTALVACLAQALDVPKSRIVLISGETARIKTVDIDADEAAIHARLSAL